MAAANNSLSHAQSVDWVFAQLSAQRHPASAAPPAAPPAPGERGDFVDLPLALSTQAPPAIDGPQDLEAARQWVQEERRRLEEYTKAQFASMRQQHQALMARHMRTEEALVLRTQEVNREMQFLAAQAKSLQEKARALADREQLLARQTESLSEAQKELLCTQETSQNIKKDMEAQVAHLNRLREETARLQCAGAEARTGYDVLEATLQERQRAWEKKQAEVSERVAQLEQRYLTLDKAEKAAERRAAELDEWEQRLQSEFEEHERQLAQQRRDLEALRAREEAVRRRREELDSRETALRQDLDRRERQLAGERRDLEAVRRRTAPLAIPVAVPAAPAN